MKILKFLGIQPMYRGLYIGELQQFQSENHDYQLKSLVKIVISYCEVKLGQESDIQNSSILEFNF